MAKLPTASMIDRPNITPRQTVASYTPLDGLGMQSVGKAIGGAASELQSQQDELDAAHVGSEFTVAYAKRLNALDSDQDFATMPERYTADMNATKDQLLAGVKNPTARAKLSARLDSVIAGGLDNVFSKQRQRQIEYGKADTARKGDEILSVMTTAKSMGDFNAPYLAYEKDVEAKVNAGILDPLEGYNATKKLKETAAETWLENQPLQDKLKYLSPKLPSASTATPVATILKNELDADGVVRVHSDGDGMAIGGINSEAYPEQFVEAKDILNTKGQEAAKEYLTAFYQKEIVEKNRVSKLTPEVQAIVADGLTNHWSGFQKKLLDAANRGDSAEHLIAMRREEYARLARENPDKYEKNLVGWNRRLDALSEGTIEKSGTPADFIPIEKRAELYQKTLTALETEYKLRREDPPKYGAKYGLTDQQIVQMQGDPFSASVVSKDDAKYDVAAMNNFQNVTDVVGFAEKIKQEHPLYPENALRDYKKAGMKPPFEAAVVLSLQNPTAYKEHIELLSEVGITGEKSITPLFQERGYDTKKLQKIITDKTEEWSLMRSNEGMTLNEHSENIEVISALAQAKMIKDGTGDYDAAVQFAMQPEVDGFATAALNGVQYRIPKADKAGGTYDINAIESRVASAYADLLPQIAEANKKKGFHLSDAIIPYLNKQGDGLEFMSPIREPILDKDGNRFTLKFDDVIAAESREERVRRIRKELESLPYSERDAYREKAFGIKIRPQKNVPAETR